MKDNSHNGWLIKNIERLDRSIERLDKILVAEKELKRMLAKMIDHHEKEMSEHRRWMRQHEVRLGEHWRHISKLK